jgi:plasmid stabilization system protein ParE
LDLAWNRWWLGFDQAGQEALLQRLFGDRRQGLGLVLLAGTGGLLALGIGWLQWLQAPARGDRLERDLQAIVRHLKRWGIEPAPGETFEQLCQRARQRLPGSQEALLELGRCHSLLRFAPLNPAAQARHWAAWRTALQALQRSPKSTL